MKDNEKKIKRIDEHLEDMKEDPSYVPQISEGFLADPVDLDEGTLKLLKRYYSGDTILFREDFVATKMWSKEDIRSRLQERGYIGTPEQIEKVINTGYLDFLEESTESDWSAIDNAIDAADLKKGMTEEIFKRDLNIYGIPDDPVWFSSFILIGVNANQVFDAINALNINPLSVGEGEITENTVNFIITSEIPEKIYALTAELHCRGYAYTNCDQSYFIAAENGEDTDDYIAEWTYPNSLIFDYEEDEEDCSYDAYVSITDPATGEKFNVGEGACDYDVFEYYENIVNEHAAK